MSASPALTLDSTVSVSTNQVSSELDGEVVILNMAAGAYHGLDETGARIWQLIQRPGRVADVLDVLIDEYDVSFDRCQHDLLELLGDLSDIGLLTRYEPVAA